MSYSDTEGPASSPDLTFSPWSPETVLTHLSERDVRFSRGLLRSRPEQWFPGFGSQWLPLAMSLGVEFKVIDVRVSLDLPTPSNFQYVATIDDEPFAIVVEEAAAALIVDTVNAGGTLAEGAAARSVLIEYFARRLLTSLTLSWSGVQRSVVSFNSDLPKNAVRGVCSIQVPAGIGGRPLSFWFVIGAGLADRLDGLWRRQLQNRTKTIDGDSDVHLEIAQLAVPTIKLGDFLSPGAVVDLGVPASDLITLRLGARMSMTGKLCVVEKNFGIEILHPAGRNPDVGAEESRLVVDLGAPTGQVARVDLATITELGHTGVVWASNFPVGSDVTLTVQGSVVGRGVLGVIDGRFAITIART